MTIERYISVLVVLVLGLFLGNGSVAEATFAIAPAFTAPACVQCPAPVNSWCVPATSGAATSVQSTNDQVVVKRVYPARGAAYALGETVGEILAFPFVAVNCLLTGCP